MENVGTIFLFLLLGVFTILVCERVWPREKLPPSRGWGARLLFAYGLIPIYMMLDSLTWSVAFQAHRVSSFLSNESPWLGGALAYFVWSFIYYWWHRASHANDRIWRFVHQIHHSPTRIEALTAYFLHPLDYLTAAIIGSFVVYSLAGLNPVAGAYMLSYSVIISMLIHSNLRLPGWVAVFIPTPEMHRIHHETDRHAGNFGTITLWDRLFGTLDERREYSGACGFADKKEERFWEMLRFVDLHSKK
jgi:sterol desaturase/sphingolipid hydroxylase (fatty acid hydroxylase superfamily)